MKGVGAENPAPCKKQDGFLSLEEANKMTYVIFRTLTGKPLFKGIVNQKARVKALTEADDPKYTRQYKAKFTVMVTAKKAENESDEPKGQFAVEHCIVKFLNPDVRQNFINVFEESRSN